MKKLNIAVAGATGNVGRKIIETLHERELPINELHALASNRSKGKKISFGDEEITIQFLDNFDFSNIDVVFSCLSNDITKSYINKALKKGCIVIDKSSLFRMDEDVPLIIPEVNEHLIATFPKKGIISSPNCVAIPLCLALSPLNNAAGIKRIVASTYQSVSGAGKEHMDELYDQTKASFMGNSPSPVKFEKSISFNLIPKIDSFNENLDTLEEEKICNESKKILGSKLSITATAVRVPVFIGHAISCNVEFNSNITAKEAEEILQEEEGINLLSYESSMNYITPKEVVGEDGVFVCRIREDKSLKNTLNMWITTDNLRKGAATNAVQILESIKTLI